MYSISQVHTLNHISGHSSLELQKITDDNTISHDADFQLLLSNPLTIIYTPLGVTHSVDHILWVSVQ